MVNSGDYNNLAVTWDAARPRCCGRHRTFCWSIGGPGPRRCLRRNCCPDDWGLPTTRERHEKRVCIDVLVLVIVPFGSEKDLREFSRSVVKPVEAAHTSNQYTPPHTTRTHHRCNPPTNSNPRNPRSSGSDPTKNRASAAPPAATLSPRLQTRPACHPPLPGNCKIRSPIKTEQEKKNQHRRWTVSEVNTQWPKVVMVKTVQRTRINGRR